MIFRRLTALFRGRLIIVGGGWGVFLVINRFNEKITLIFLKFNCEYKFEQARMYQILTLLYERTIYGSCTTGKSLTLIFSLLQLYMKLKPTCFFMS